MANIPYNVVENPYFKDFMACLRPSFVAPSRYILQKEIAAVFVDAQSAVDRLLSETKSVFLAVDGWEDAQHLPVLGITALPPGKKPLLSAFDRMEERESGEFLEDNLKKAISSLNSYKTTVAGIVADNAKNMQSALRKAQAELNIPGVRCQGHTGSLLLEDVCGKFQATTSKMSALEQFFRFTHYARTTYVAMSDIEGVSLHFLIAIFSFFPFACV